MPFRQLGSIRSFEFACFDHPRLVHGVFARHGGVSPGRWRSLNVGSTVGDDLERVEENRRRIFAAAGLDPASIYDVWQIHSAEIEVARAPRQGARVERADAIITNSPDVTLFMRFADCVPVMLFDPVQMAVGIAHAGWLGTVRKTVSAIVKRMCGEFGCQPADLRAGVGPSIGAHHYPVGPEVESAFRESFGAGADQHLQVHNSAVHLDLWSANRVLLEEEGVREIEEAGVCTACHPEDWFSHRREAGRTGRFGALIALKSAGRSLRLERE